MEKEKGKRQRGKDKRHPREALSLSLSLNLRVDTPLFARGLWRNIRKTLETFETLETWWLRFKSRCLYGV